MYVGFQCTRDMHRDSVFPFDGLYEKKKKKSKPFHAYVVSFPRTSSVSRHRFVRIVNGGSQTVRNFSATLRVSR